MLHHYGDMAPQTLDAWTTDWQMDAQVILYFVKCSASMIFLPQVVYLFFCL